MQASRLVLVLIAMLTAPLMAQEAQEAQAKDQAQAEADAPTPEDDLDCAMFLSALLGSEDPSMSQDDQTGIVSGMSYFVGRFEAARGEIADTAMVERYPEFAKGDFEQYAAVCSMRMEAYGNRLLIAGEAISNIEAEALRQAEQARGETDMQEDKREAG